MKRIIRVIPMVATALIISAQGYATEPSLGRMGEVNKDECLLVAMNCKNQVDSIQERIDRLHGEIGRGRDVYSADELRVLRDKLDEANKILDSLVNSGGA